MLAVLSVCSYKTLEEEHLRSIPIVLLLLLDVYAQVLPTNRGVDIKKVSLAEFQSNLSLEVSFFLARVSNFEKQKNR